MSDQSAMCVKLYAGRGPSAASMCQHKRNSACSCSCTVSSATASGKGRHCFYQCVSVASLQLHPVTQSILRPLLLMCQAFQLL